LGTVEFHIAFLLRWLLIRVTYDFIRLSTVIPTVVSSSSSIENSSNGSAGGDLIPNLLESIDKISLVWLNL
jgi:hypothetical protein